MNTLHLAPGNIDLALRTHRAPGTRFVLGPGIYTTRGGFGFPDLDLCLLAPNCELVGAGTDRTLIRLVNPVLVHAGQPTQYTEVLTGGARTAGRSDRLTMSDFTLDLSEAQVPTVGIHLWTTRATVSGVKVIGVRGSRTHTGQVKEGFGILVNSCPDADFDGGHLVSCCSVHLARVQGENYSNGIFVGCPKRDSWSLLVSDLLGLPSLAGKLKQPNRALDTWLAAQFSQDTRDALALYQGPGSDATAVQSSMLYDLNGILLGHSIHDPQRFAGIALRPETQALMARNPGGLERARLNRMLIEDAYPLEISRVLRQDVALLRSTVRDCVCEARGAHAAYAANDHTDFVDCQAHGFIRFFFCDTGPVRETTFRGVFADDIQWAIDVRVGIPGDERRGIVVTDSTFVFSEPTGGWVQAVLAADEAKPKGTALDDILFVRCRFVARTSTNQASKGRSHGREVGAIALVDCRWVGPWQPPVIQNGAKPW